MISNDVIAAKAQAIRRRCIMMARERGQGYVGQGLALADLMAVLYFDELRREPDGTLRDRLILSTGHSAIAIFAALGELGEYADAELATYGQDGSRIEESPLAGTPGFPITGGSLGQGLSQAVGLALGDRILGRDIRTFCLISDGELQEGQIWEAAMSAAHYRLSNLVVLIDNNHMQADGDPAEVMGVAPIAEKFVAFGFNARDVDGHDLNQLRAALSDTLNSEPGRPTALICETVPGKGSPTLEGYRKVHYIRGPAALWMQALAEL
jgi:transketolase